MARRRKEEPGQLGRLEARVPTAPLAPRIRETAPTDANAFRDGRQEKGAIAAS